MKDSSLLDQYSSWSNHHLNVRWWFGYQFEKGLPSEPLGLRKEKGFRAKEKDVSNFGEMLKGKAGQ